MRTNVKEAVASETGQTTGQTGQTRSQATAQLSTNLIQEKIDNARISLKKSIKTQIVVGSVSDALYEISQGLFSEDELLALNSLDAFSNAFEATYIEVLEGEKETPFLLSASDPKMTERLEEIYQIEVQENPLTNPITPTMQTSSESDVEVEPKKRGRRSS